LSSLATRQDVLVCVSGRGDKDVSQIRAALPQFGLDARALPSIY
jgi:tryptophan synthase beta subunit